MYVVLVDDGVEQGCSPHFACCLYTLQRHACAKFTHGLRRYLDASSNVAIFSPLLRMRSRLLQWWVHEVHHGRPKTSRSVACNSLKVRRVDLRLMVGNDNRLLLQDKEGGIESTEEHKHF